MLHVACSTNARFAPDCAVMLASLIATNPADAVHVHLLHDDSITPAAIDSLCALVVERGGRCDPITLTPGESGIWPDSDRFPANAWYRVRLAELLPELPRVLYVDADAMITAPLDELWRTDLAGHPLGAITNPLYASMVGRIQADLGVPGGWSYFNSGVLLMDLEMWRRERIPEAIAGFVADHPLVWPDQDALNGVLHARRLHLHPRWNAMPGLWELPERYLPYTPAQRREAAADPAIVHFVGPHKPWHFRSRHPYRAAWFRYLEATPWQGRPVEGRSLGQALLRTLPTVWAYRVEVGVGRSRAMLHSGRTRIQARLG